MTQRDLSALLTQASAHVREIDFVERAWANAQAARRRQRRWVVGAIAAGAAGAVALGFGVANERPQKPLVDLSQETPDDHQPGHRIADGTVLTLAPVIGLERALQPLSTDLPATFTDQLSSKKLSASHADFGAGREKVAAVLLRSVGDRQYRAVLVPEAGPEVDVDKVTLAPVTDAGGNLAAPLTTHAISPDGLSVMFPQPGKVVVVRADTGVAKSIAIDDFNVEQGGWTSDGTMIVAKSFDRTWLVNVAKGAVVVQATGLPAYENRYRITTIGLAPTVETFGDNAQRTGVSQFDAPIDGVNGDTVSSPDGWSAAAVSLNQEKVNSPSIDSSLSTVSPGYQGLLALRTDVPTTRRVLVMPNDERRKDCCRVLGFHGPWLLYLSQGPGNSTWVLGWNVLNGQIAGVSLIRGESGLVPGVMAINLH